MGFSRQEYWNGVPLPSLPLTCGKCQKPAKGANLALNPSYDNYLLYDHLGMPGGLVQKLKLGQIPSLRNLK